MKSQASLGIIWFVMLTVMRKEMLMATYYIGADVHSNNTELAIEQRGKLVARYWVLPWVHLIWCVGTEII